MPASRAIRPSRRLMQTGPSLRFASGLLRLARAVRGVGAGARGAPAHLRMPAPSRWMRSTPSARGGWARSISKAITRSGPARCATPSPRAAALVRALAGAAAVRPLHLPRPTSGRVRALYRSRGYYHAVVTSDRPVPAKGDVVNVTVYDRGRHPGRGDGRRPRHRRRHASRMPTSSGCAPTCRSSRATSSRRSATSGAARSCATGSASAATRA